MSTDLTIIPDNVQLPAHMQPSTEAASDLVVADSFLPRVVAKDGHFVIKKDGDEKHLPLGQPVEVVILAATPKGRHVSKVFYAGAFSGESHDAPDCSSSDGVAPDAGVPAPQSQTCATCPQNAWGSGKDAQGNPSKGKACSDRKELLIVQSHKIGDDVYNLSIPPTSLKPLSVFGRELAKHNIPMDGIKTTIGFDPENPRTLTFGFVEFLDAASYAQAQERATSDDVLDHVIDPEAKPTIAATAQLDAPVVQESTTLTQAPADDDWGSSSPAEPAGADVDAAGVAWDPELHAANKAKKADGTWKAKRGVAKKPEPEATPDPVQESAPATQPASTAELDSILSDW